MKNSNRDSKAAKERRYMSITIPAPIYNKIQAKIKGTSFSSVSDYVTYVLRETGSEIAISKINKKENNSFIQRLKVMGYE
jgi:Arc/MetJ-type ribon-helix-helix transcriptional regulator